LRRRVLWITLGTVVGVPLLAVLAIVVYLQFGDLSRHRVAVEDLLSEALGRRLQIAGNFDPKIGRVSTVTASGVTLANAPWGSRPEMVTVDRLLCEVDLWSILRPPIEIHRVELAGARVLVETSADGLLNWDIGSAEEVEREPSEPPEIVIGSVTLKDVDATYLDASSGRALHLHTDSLEVIGLVDDMLEVAFDGAIEDTPIVLSGHLGPFNAALRGEKFEHDLVGRFGDAELRSRGRIDGLAELRQVHLETAIETSDVGILAQSLGVPRLGTGPFFLRASVTPSADTHEVLLETNGAGIKAHVEASLVSLMHPGSFTINLDASGPDASSVGDLVGLPGLAEADFSIRGAARCCEFPIVFDQVVVQAGGLNAAVNGVIGEPPQLLGSDLTFKAAGPDLSLVEAITGIDLPPGSFNVAGRLVRRTDRVHVENLDVRLGDTTLAASGTLGEPPEFRGIDFRLRASGSDLSRFSGLAGVDLPKRRFSAQGRLQWQDDAILLDGLAAEVGDGKIKLAGRIRPENGLRGSVLEVLVEGSDAAAMAAMAGVSGPPAKAVRIEGKVTILGRGYRLERVGVELGDLSGTVDGVVTVSPTFEGSDLSVLVEGGDASWVGALAGLERLPPDRFRLAGRVAVADDGYRVDDGQAEYLGTTVGIDGLIGAWPECEANDLILKVNIADLSRLEEVTPNLGLPDGGRLPESGFSFTGRVAGSLQVIALSELDVRLGANRLRVDGDVYMNDGFKGSSLRLRLDVPDLEELGSLVRIAGIKLPELPHEPSSVNGRLTVDDAGYGIDDARFSLGTAVAKVDGRLGLQPIFHGTDLVVDVNGPNASLFTAVTGVSVPVAPFVVQGRVGWTSQGALFDDLSVRLGEYTAHVDGTLGPPPKLIGTALEVNAQGPGTGLIRDISGRASLPDEPFQIVARLEGTPQKFSADGLEARFGTSDIEGGLTADLRGRPSVTGRFTSNHLDLSFLAPNPGAREASEREAEPEPSNEVAERRFSDELLDFSVLDRVDADVEIVVGLMELPRLKLNDLRIGLKLIEGRLAVDPLAAVGHYGGRLQADYVLEPFGSTHRMKLRGVIEDARLQMTRGEQGSESWPSFDLDLDLEATGRSPHELAASANGWYMVALGTGQMDSSILDLVSTDLVLEVLNTLNPFDSKADTTILECAVFFAALTDGLMHLEPLALQTESMTLVGDGWIDFDTERLDLEWVTKPRKGFGLSASTLTNPYIKIGGTLTSPALEMKGLQALTATGAAVATGGLTLLAGGLWDRVTSERKVCKKAFKELEEKLPPDRKERLTRR